MSKASLSQLSSLLPEGIEWIANRDLPPNTFLDPQRAGASDGLSIGFRTVKGRIDPKTRIRKLDAIDLWEISIVTFPLLAGARAAACHPPPALQDLIHARVG